MKKPLWAADWVISQVISPRTPATVWLEPAGAGWEKGLSAAVFEVFGLAGFDLAAADDLAVVLDVGLLTMCECPGTD